MMNPHTAFIVDEEVTIPQRPLTPSRLLAKPNIHTDFMSSSSVADCRYLGSIGVDRLVCESGEEGMGRWVGGGKEAGPDGEARDGGFGKGD